MPDEVLAHGAGSKFAPHPAGTFPAVCVDTVALGLRVMDSYLDKDGEAKLVPKCALVFRTGKLNEQGVPYDVNTELTVSMFERSNLRLLLEAWRGSTYSDAQAEKGVALSKLVGQPALISVEQRMSAKKRLYAAIKSIMPLPEGMAAPAGLIEGYKRSEYWDEKKKLYADEVASWRAAHVKLEVERAGEGEDEDDDDDLPF